jgi:phosphoserine phosphatase
MRQYTIVQSRILTPEILEELSFFQPRRLNEQAALIEHEDATLKKATEALKLDLAYVPLNQKLEHIGLVAMDMDSTLITIECIDEIADFCGLKAEVAAITKRSMAGEIDFAQSLKERVALLKGLPLQVLEEVYEKRLALNPGAERLLAELKKRGIKTLLVSGGFTFFTERLQKRLDLDYAFANTLEVNNGILTGNIVGEIVDARKKAFYLAHVCKKENLLRQETVAVGDGANDLLMLEQASISVAYHAKAIVQQKARYCLNHSGLDGVLNLFTDFLGLV